MKNISLVIVTSIILCLAAGGASVTSSCATAGEWQQRGRLEFRGPLEDHLDIRMMTELRSGGSFRIHKESHFDVGLEWKLIEWLGVAPYYRNVVERNGPIWRVEHRPHINLTLKWAMMGMRFSDRSRLEYRMIGSAHNTRYRNRFMLSLPSGLIPRLSPYCSTEPYYDFDAGKINKNRLIAGFDFRVMGRTSLGVAYVLDSVKRADRWHDINSLLVAFKYKPYK